MADVSLSREEARYLADLLTNEIDVIGTDRCEEHGIDPEPLIARLEAVE